MTEKVKDLGEEEIMLPRMLLINSPIGPEDEIIVPGDLDCSCNMICLIWLLPRINIDIFVTIDVDLQ